MKPDWDISILTLLKCLCKRMKKAPPKGNFFRKLQWISSLLKSGAYWWPFRVLTPFSFIRTLPNVDCRVCLHTPLSVQSNSPTVKSNCMGYNYTQNVDYNFNRYRERLIYLHMQKWRWEVTDMGSKSETVSLRSSITIINRSSYVICGSTCLHARDAKTSGRDF